MAENKIPQVDEGSKAVDGQSFYSEALTGSGTILPDGTLTGPMPDPTVMRGGPAGEHTSPGGVDRAGARIEPVAASVDPARDEQRADRSGDADSGTPQQRTGQKPRAAR